MTPYLLARVDTPTVGNAIKVMPGMRGLWGPDRGTMACTKPGRAIVGIAGSARIAAYAPLTGPPKVIRTRRMGCGAQCMML